MSNPLITTFDQLRAVSSYLNVTFTSPTSDQFTVSGWIDDQTGIFARLQETIRTRRHCEDRQYLGMAILDTTWLTTMSSLACLYAAQRFPDLSHDNVFYRVNEESYLREITLKNPYFYALATDPDANHPDCIGTFATFEALRDHARSQLEAHIAPLIDVIKQKTSLGKRAMWSGVADRCAQIIMTVHNLLGKMDACEAEIAHFLEGSPLKGKTGIQWVTKDDRQHPFLARGACCLSYKLDKYDYCRTCPLLNAKEREAKLLETLG